MGEEFDYRLLEDLQMTAGVGVGVAVDLSRTSKATNVSSVSVTRSGWARLDVVPLQDGQEGDVVGTVLNSWGDFLENVTVPVTGRVLTVRVDPAVEMDADVVDVVYNVTAEAQVQRVSRHGHS